MADNEKPEKLIPFSDYDYFGYLSCGFIVVAAVDFLRGGKLLEAEKIGIPEGIFLLVVAYIIGQIIAEPSQWLLERIIVNRLLKRPNENLFQEPDGSLQRRLFSGYYTPFPKTVQQRIRAKAEAASVQETGEALFVEAFSRVKNVGAAMARLDSFRNLYGFCRNVSFTCLVVALVIAVWVQAYGDRHKLQWAAVAIIVSIGMFYRYLKFLHQYSQELFMSYLGLPADTSSETGDKEA